MKKLFLVLLFTFTASWCAATTLSNAVGQMMLVGFNGTTINKNSEVVKAIKNYHVGGVIIFDHVDIQGKKVLRNIKNPAQLKTLTTALQKYAKKYHDFPLFIAVNQEGGLINTLKTKKGFSLGKNYSEQTLGKLNDQQLILQQAYERGLLLKKYGINLNFAPVAGLNINPKNPAIGALQRSFGSSPAKVTKDLWSAIKGYRKSGIMCSLKHFPGLGSASANTDFAKTVDVTHTFHFSELLPYELLIKQAHACEFIMVTHLINRKLDPSGMVASLSKPIVTKLLRHKLHFQGLTITDDMDAAAIRENFTTTFAIRKAILAGEDIILYGGTGGHNPSKDTSMLYHTMMKLAQKNRAIKQKIFAAYKRITQTKAKNFAY